MRLVTRERSRLFSVLLAAGLAACGTGQQVAAGPVVGYIPGRGLSTGWEAGGGPMSTPTAAADPAPSLGSLLTRFSVGMSWRPDARPDAGTERLTYLAWEPWLGAGGTLGAALSSNGPDLRPMVGIWEAAPWVIGAPKRSAPLTACSPCMTISLAVGWRWAAGAGEFYLAPKLGILNDTMMPYPFQTWAD